MTKLEEAILEGAKTAQKDYFNMTGGYWLWHGPEYFISYTVAMKLKEEKFLVYPEASPKKIMEGRGERPKGRPAGNLGQRFDLVIWEKTTDNIKAVLEIKQAWDIAGLKSDREKISKFIKQKQYVKSGYLLTYTQAKGVKRVQTLENRLKRA